MEAYVVDEEMNIDNGKRKTALFSPEYEFFSIKSYTRFPLLPCLFSQKDAIFSLLYHVCSMKKLHFYPSISCL